MKLFFGFRTFNLLSLIFLLNLFQNHFKMNMNGAVNKIYNILTNQIFRSARDANKI